MLYEMLVGERPFISRALPALIRKHLVDTPRPLREIRPELSPGVEAVVLRTLAKEPALRPSARVLARDFDAALQSAPQGP